MRETQAFKVLERKKLQDGIARIEEVPLLLLQAPMGFGKTTAVRTYIQKNTNNYIWVSLGLESVQEEWVWSQMNEKLRAIDNQLAEQLLEMGLPKTKTELDNLFDLLRSGLRGKELYVILDDYQSCDEPALNQLFERVAYEDIPGVHVVLISRNYVKLSVEELLLRNYCEVLGREDFILSKEDTVELFRLNGVELTEEESDIIYAYTDGWIAAVSLLWREYKKNGVLQFTGSIHGLLREAVYDKLDDDDKQILCQMSLFNEFTAEEMEWMTQKRGGRRRLGLLMEKTGLIHYNQRNQGYMMHSLLCAVAEEEIEERHIDVRDSYRRYAQYQEKTGNLVVALKFYDQAGDREAVFHLLETDGRFELIEHLEELLFDFFQKKENQEAALQHPVACFTYLYVMAISAERKFSEWGKRFFTYVREQYSEEREPELLGELLVIEVLMQFNDLVQMNKTMKRALELRESRPSVIFWKRIYSYGVPETLFLYHRKPGTLKESVAQEKEYSRNYMRLLYNVDGEMDSLVVAEYSLETGHPEEALAPAENTRAKARFRQQICGVISSCMVLLRCQSFLGDRRGFEETIADCAQMMGTITKRILVMDYELMLGYAYAITGQLNKIPAWLREGKFESCNQVVRDSRTGCIIYGIYLCWKKKWTLLSAAAEEMAASYGGTRHVFSEIYSDIFRSIACWNLSEKDKAIAWMKDALLLASCDGIRMPFVELSLAALPILQELSQENLFASELLPLCDRWQKGISAFSEEYFVEALFTPRERELLELLVQGYRNSDISRKLNVAQVTVEKNLTNIYRKIGVSNRTSAVRWFENVYKA